MTDDQIVSHDDWIAARGRSLAKEREFTRLRAELRRERRELPWECVKKEYVFEGENGRETLAHLFGGRSQLIVYHFMYEPDWDIGCKNWSFWADDFNGIIPHLNERDMSLVATSRAPLEKLQAEANASAGRSSGSPALAAISTLTSTSGSRRRHWCAVKRSTTTGVRRSRGRRGPGSARSSRTLGSSSIPIPRTRVAFSICRPAASASGR